MRCSSAGVRCLLVILFLWAGAGKLLDPRAFAGKLDAFGLVPEAWLVGVALALPLLELFAALAVALRWRSGLPLMAALLLLFIGVLRYGVLAGLEVDCGCFSLGEQAEHTSLREAFWRDWLMLLGVAYLVLIDRLSRKGRAPALPQTHLQPQGEEACSSKNP